MDTLIVNIGQLLTMEGDGPVKGEQMKTLPLMEQAAIGIKDGRVAWIGSNAETKTISAKHIRIHTLYLLARANMNYR